MKDISMMANHILNMLHVVLIALIQQTKRDLRMTAIDLKIRERILRRICFEIRKSNSNFHLSTFCGAFEGGPWSKCRQYFPP